ncbi:MAG: hypothetical protein ACJAWS_000189 [Oleiphilaceae bacterium]
MINRVIEKGADFFRHRKEDIQDYLGGGILARIIGIVISVYLILTLVFGWWWSQEPEMIDIQQYAVERAGEQGHAPVTGYTTTTALIYLAETMLDKPGGYLRNDIFPPGLLLDNIPRWEFGVLVQVRDLARAFRKDFSRSQSQSVEDKDLIIAEPQFHFDNNSWAIPATESEYRHGIKAMHSYLNRLAQENQADAQFYARADNLRAWLSEVNNRLGGLSHRLTESVGREQLDLALAGDVTATQSTTSIGTQEKKTPWLELDNIFYEARGTTWALVHILKAVEYDFRDLLESKNALVSLKQIILELEATQESFWSPMVLNGDGFGLLSNHSLTMSSYISRASAAIIDLRNLLQQ